MARFTGGQARWPTPTVRFSGAGAERQMRYGIFSDTHANIEALTTVLAAFESERIDRYVCIGDTVGYGASPNQCCDHLELGGRDERHHTREEPIELFLGNERMRDLPQLVMRDLERIRLATVLDHEGIDDDLLTRSEAMDTPDSLFHLHRVPRNIDVDETWLRRAASGPAGPCQSARRPATRRARLMETPFE